MRFSGVSAIAIWNAATRSLTGFGTAVLLAGNASTSIAAATSVDLQPPSGQAWDHTIAVKTGATATALTSINIWDGTTPLVLAQTAAAANAFAGFGVVSNNSLRARLTNTDGAVAATYMHCGVRWVFP